MVSETRRSAHPVKGSIAGGDGHRPPLIGERSAKKERPHIRRKKHPRGRGIITSMETLVRERRRFFERPAEPRILRITSRDLELLRNIARLRLASAPQLAAL